MQAWPQLAQLALGLGMTLLAACGSVDNSQTNTTGPSTASPNPEAPSTTTIEVAPEPIAPGTPDLGAAVAVDEPALFDELDRLATDLHTGHLIPALIDADVTGLTLSTLLKGPHGSPSADTTGRGLGALGLLPPYRTSLRRSSWPELYGRSATGITCTQGSLTHSLEDATPRPYLKLQFKSCLMGPLLVDGNLLIERPANALDLPTRIGYDNISLTESGYTQRITGTITWADGDDCGVHERRIIHIHSSEPDSGSSVLLDGLESYTTAPALFSECGEADVPNGWRGRIAFGSHGVVTIDTPQAFTHDWAALPRQSTDEVLFGTHIPAAGTVRMRGNTSDDAAVQTTLSLVESDIHYPDSAEPVLVRVALIRNSIVSQSFFATLPDTRSGELSALLLNFEKAQGSSTE